MNATGANSREEEEPFEGDFALEDSSGEELPEIAGPGEEPVVKARRPAARPAAQWLAFWLILTGLIGAFFGVISVLTAGAEEALRQAFTFILSLLLLCGGVALLRGSSAAGVCRKSLGVVGLILGAVTVLETLLRLCSEAASGGLARGASADLILLLWIGLSVGILFVYAIRDAGWASRCLAVGIVVFLVSLLACGASDPRLVADSFAAVREVARAQWLPLGLSGICAVALAIMLVLDLRAGFGSRIGLVAGALWALLFAAAAGYAAYAGARELGQERMARGLAALGASGAAAGLLPLLLVGLGAAWRQGGRLGQDVLEVARFGWLVAALGAFAVLAVWLPRAAGRGLFEVWLVMVGLLSMLIVCRHGRQENPWLAKWALLPAAAAVALTLQWAGGMTPLVSAAAPFCFEAVGAALPLFLWLILAVTAVFAASGLVRAARAERDAAGSAILIADANIAYTAGWSVSAFVLSLMFAARAGDESVEAGLRAFAIHLGQVCREALEVAVGRQVSSWFGGAAAWLGGVVFDGGTLALAALGLFVALVLCLHVVAGKGSRLANLLVGLLWVLATAAVGCVAALLAVRLFRPPTAGFATAPARILSAHLGARVMLLAVLFALAVRFRDSFRATFALARRTFAAAPSRSARQREGESAAPFTRLVNLGMIACSAGLGLSLVLAFSVSPGQSLPGMRGIAVAFSETVALLTARTGLLAAASGGFALAAGAIVFASVVLHAEARLGRIAAYPWVAGFWTALLTLSCASWGRVAGWWGPVPVASAVPAFVMAISLWLILALTTICLWVRWWRLAARGAPGGLDRRWRSGSSRALGGIGLALSMLFGSMVLYNALWQVAALREHLAVLEAGADKLIGTFTYGVALVQVKLEQTGGRWLIASALGVVSVLLVAVHYAAQSGLRWAKVCATALWSAVLVASLAVAGYVFDLRTLGNWDSLRIAAALLFAAFVAGLFPATIHCWVRLVARSGEKH